MNVAIDSSCLAINPFSGLSEVVHNLLLHLPLVSGSDEFICFINCIRPKDCSRRAAYPGVKTRRLILPRRLLDFSWQRGWPALDSYMSGVDIFHSLHINVPPAKRIKTVLTVHDCRYVALPELYPPRDVESYRRRMTRSLSRVDRIVAVSDFTRHELLSHFSLPEERVRVIHNGFQPYRPGDSGAGRTDRVAAADDLPQDYLLCITSLDPRKNLQRLIEALAQCRKESSEFPDLIVAGITSSQWVRSPHAAIAGRLGVLDCIHVCGMLGRSALTELMRKARALCYPSIYEGFGFPPLEAMSQGVPVLAADSSSTPEITGQAACLVDPRDVDSMARGLRRVVFDTDYRRSLVESGRNRINKYSWQKCAMEYVALYREML